MICIEINSRIGKWAAAPWQLKVDANKSTGLTLGDLSRPRHRFAVGLLLGHVAHVALHPSPGSWVLRATLGRPNSDEQLFLLSSILFPFSRCSLVEAARRRLSHGAPLALLPRLGPSAHKHHGCCVWATDLWRHHWRFQRARQQFIIFALRRLMCTARWVFFQLKILFSITEVFHKKLFSLSYKLTFRQNLHL